MPASDHFSGTVHALWESLDTRHLRGGHLRVYQALPSVLLGILLNTLDAGKEQAALPLYEMIAHIPVTTGLLVFPSTGSVYGELQAQAMSLYIMR